MYFSFIEEGFIANPQFLENPKRWRDPSLFRKLKRKKIDLEEIDSIFRKHHVECHVISEWIAARDRMKEIKKGISLKLGGDVVKIIPKDLKEAIEKVIEGIQGLERIERDLNDRVVKSFGPLGIRKLTRKDVKQWPVFTSIMIDLYNHLIHFYKTKPHYYNELRDQSKYSRYPEKLFQVIAGLLQEYYPTYFKDFSPNAAKTRLNHSLQR